MTKAEYLEKVGVESCKKQKELFIQLGGRNKGYYGDFPGGPVVKNPPSNAGNVSSIPGQGTKIPHVSRQLNPRATTIELVRLNEKVCVLQTTEPTRSGAQAPQLEREKPHATTREKLMRLNKSSCMPHRRSCMLQLRPDAAK